VPPLERGHGAGSEAAEIVAFINDALRVVPGLAQVTVQIVRLSTPDATGCNWTPQHATPPAGCPAESVRLLHDVLRTARRQFNLWEVH